MTNGRWETESGELFVLDFHQCVRMLVRLYAPLPSESGEKEALINLQVSQHFEGWDCASCRSKVIGWLSCKQACFCVTQGWCEKKLIPAGALCPCFYLRTTPRAVLSCLAAQICSFFHLETFFFRLLWLNIKISLSLIFPSLSTWKQNNYSPLVSNDGWRHLLLELKIQAVHFY